jgi:RNA polymerase sigma-70 factor (ECF subfamily)
MWNWIGDSPALLPEPDAPETFEAFFAREYVAVVGLAVVLSGSREHAEDIAQDAFLAAHRRWPEISTFDRPEAWVRRVVANLSASWVRRKWREARALTRASQGRGVPTLVDAEQHAFWSTVASLPRRQAQCVALFYLEDRSVRDIATILELSESTVKVHLHNGRTALAEKLDERRGDSR